MKPASEVAREILASWPGCHADKFDDSVAQLLAQAILSARREALDQVEQAAHRAAGFPLSDEYTRIVAAIRTIDIGET